MLRSRLKLWLPGRIRSVALCLLLVADVARGEEGTRPSAGAEVVRARWLMGTVLEVRFPVGTPRVDALAEAAFAEVSKVEAAASLWRPGTELAEVHARTAAGESVTLSGTLGDLVLESLRAAELSGGAFSPAVGALVASFDLRGAGRWPAEAERHRAAELARPQGVLYDPATRSLRLGPGVTLDLDGIAKGFALDRATTALRDRGVEDALLNFGGQLLVIGPPPSAPPREATVVSPAEPGVPVLSVRLRDASLSTSANVERLRVVDGREAGHLVDPRTGLLVPFTGSVSVVAATGALADALSTAWAVEGPEAYRRSDPGSSLRQVAAVAFALPQPGGGCETVADIAFERIRPTERVAGPVARGP